MDLFAQQLFTGLANGSIYGFCALALVMIYQSIGHVNFAQGEMAMFSTFLAWQLIQMHVPFAIAFIIAVAISFAGGVAIDKLIFKRLRTAEVLTQIVVFIGLLSAFNGVAGFIWDFTSKPFPTPFGNDPFLGSALLSSHQVGTIAMMIVLLVLLYLFFHYTNLGLSMKSATENPVSARLVGIRVETMIALGWGLAASIGAIAGIFIAPVVFLEPNMMIGILLYGFAAAVLGGLSSPLGAVIGGILVGTTETLVSTYVPGGNELKLSIALAIIICVLTFKPTGLFGESSAKRV